MINPISSVDPIYVSQIGKAHLKVYDCLTKLLERSYVILRVLTLGILIVAEHP